MMTVKYDFAQFDPAVRELLEHEAPKRVRQALAKGAGAIAKLLRAASPSGRGPYGPKRLRNRARFPGGDYGPIRRGWKVTSRGARLQYEAYAKVRLITFYGGFIEFGTAPTARSRMHRAGPRAVIRSYRYHPRAHAARPFAEPILARGAEIAGVAITAYLDGVK